jgi:hypothetical protein
MTRRHKLSSALLRLLEVRANGTGLFEDATGRVVVDMRHVEKNDEYSARRGEKCPA